MRRLVVQAILGIHPHERVTPQPVRISFAMATDTRAAAESEDIGKAVDYARAAERVTALTRNGQFQLAETLAEHIAALLLAEFACDRVRVEVEKPDALADAESVGVSIERRRRATPGG
ncbi:MAG: dihydroneopterin aldolase [Pseudomonadales bacterium]|nr:dihydroneopterin aldolase [Pseudomonadales bacterium]